jgi:hypothetical protein
VRLVVEAITPKARNCLPRSSWVPVEGGKCQRRSSTPTCSRAATCPTPGWPQRTRFPIRITPARFHADSASEYTNHRVAELFQNRLVIEFTKTRLPSQKDALDLKVGCWNYSGRTVKVKVIKTSQNQFLSPFLNELRFVDSRAQK